MRRVTTHDAKTHLSRLIAEAERGGEILICRGRQPAARLLAARISRRPSRPRVGTRTSERIRWVKDAFAPLDENALAEWGL